MCGLYVIVSFLILWLKTLIPKNKYNIFWLLKNGVTCTKYSSKDRKFYLGSEKQRLRKGRIVEIIAIQVYSVAVGTILIRYLLNVSCY